MTPQDSERPTVAWWVMLTSLMVLGMLLVSGAKAHAVAHLMFDLRDRGKTINNKYSMLNSWFYDPTWRSVAAEHPADYMKTIAAVDGETVTVEGGSTMITPIGGPLGKPTKQREA